MFLGLFLTVSKGRGYGRVLLAEAKEGQFRGKDNICVRMRERFGRVSPF